MITNVNVLPVKETDDQTQREAELGDLNALNYLKKKARGHVSKNSWHVSLDIKSRHVVEIVQYKIRHPRRVVRGARDLFIA